jgi:hypothetical protein
MTVSAEGHFAAELVQLNGSTQVPHVANVRLLPRIT